MRNCRADFNEQLCSLLLIRKHERSLSKPTLNVRKKLVKLGFFRFFGQKWKCTNLNFGLNESLCQDGHFKVLTKNFRAWQRFQKEGSKVGIVIFSDFLAVKIAMFQGMIPKSFSGLLRG